MSATTHKVCKGCRVELPSDSFYRHTGGRDGLRAKCKRCVRVDVKTDYAMRQWGMSLVEYESYLDTTCAVASCDRRAGAIDHDHETGRIRGPLCGTHNKGIGQCGDTVESLIEVLQYLLGAA